MSALTEAQATFAATIKIFQEKNQTLSYAYRMAWKVPYKFYRDKTSEEAYSVLCEQYT